MTPAQTDKVVFTTEAIENIPAGWRARETYVVHRTDAFEEIFELAEPGKDFEAATKKFLPGSFNPSHDWSGGHRPPFRS